MHYIFRDCGTTELIGPFKSLGAARAHQRMKIDLGEKDGRVVDEEEALELDADIHLSPEDDSPPELPPERRPLHRGTALMSRWDGNIR